MSAVTRAEVAALLAVAQDHAFGQPPGAQLRAAVIGQRLASAGGLDRLDIESCWWVSALRFLGCTGHAFDVAVVFGDEIELRAASLQVDAANPLDMLRLMVTSAGGGSSGVRRLRSVAAVLAGGKKAAELNFRAACEVAEVLGKRLGLSDQVRASLATNFERWNGRGLPAGLKGTQIPLSMRVAQLAHEFEVLCRVEGPGEAQSIIRRRRGKAYDPELADLVLIGGAEWWEQIEPLDPWDEALACAPQSAPLDGEELDDAFLVLADFADLKSPWLGGHSREVARLAGEAGGPDCRRAALVHDLGRVAVPNSIWDKGGTLTRDERDRVEQHALVADQLLRRLPSTAHLADVAAAAHERLDGSGYHRRLRASHLDRAARILAAADCYEAMTAPRPHRPAHSRHEAAAELRSMARSGSLDAEATEKVLAAAGHHRVVRVALPAGLTTREAEVLRLLALGLTTRQIAVELGLSSKTADHHIQHVYAKIGVSTRGAATLFAIEHGILTADD